MVLEKRETGDTDGRLVVLCLSIYFSGLETNPAAAGGCFGFHG